MGRSHITNQLLIVKLLKQQGNHRVVLRINGTCMGCHHLSI